MVKDINVKEVNNIIIFFLLLSISYYGGKSLGWYWLWKIAQILFWFNIVLIGISFIVLIVNIIFLRKKKPVYDALKDAESRK